MTGSRISETVESLRRECQRFFLFGKTEADNAMVVCAVVESRHWNGSDTGFDDHLAGKFLLRIMIELLDVRIACTHKIGAG